MGGGVRLPAREGPPVKPAEFWLSATYFSLTSDFCTGFQSEQITRMRPRQPSETKVYMFIVGTLTSTCMCEALVLSAFVFVIDDDQAVITSTLTIVVDGPTVSNK